MLYSCRKCNSENIQIRQAHKRTGLYCKDCGAWIQWVTYREAQRMHDHLKKKGFADNKAFKRVCRSGTHTIIRCSECDTQLYHTNAPAPVGQFDLIDAVFCPKCGKEFV